MNPKVGFGLERAPWRCPAILVVCMVGWFLWNASPSVAGTYRTNLWPNGEVPFDFDPGMTAAQQQLAMSAMTVWTNVANISFRPVGLVEVAYVHFRDSGGDPLPANYVGLIGLDGLGWGFGPRNVNIATWNLFTIVHELGHIMGMPHEQNRPDRDASVTIETSNAVADLFNFNFLLDPTAETYGPYDFDSIMQYGACAFSVCGSCSATDPNCRTITTHDPAMQSVIGQRSHLSRMDELTMSFLYPQSDWRFVDDDDGTLVPSGTFLDPWATVGNGVSATPLGGTLWIQPGGYAETVTLHRSMLVRAPLGGVTIGR
jgi:hypothetical protein